MNSGPSTEGVKVRKKRAFNLRCRIQENVEVAISRAGKYRTWYTPRPRKHIEASDPECDRLLLQQEDLKGRIGVLESSATSPEKKEDILSLLRAEFPQIAERHPMKGASASTPPSKLREGFEPYSGNTMLAATPSSKYADWQKRYPGSSPPTKPTPPVLQDSGAPSAGNVPSSKPSSAGIGKLGKTMSLNALDGGMKKLTLPPVLHDSGAFSAKSVPIYGPGSTGIGGPGKTMSSPGVDGGKKCPPPPVNAERPIKLEREVIDLDEEEFGTRVKLEEEGPGTLKIDDNPPNDPYDSSADAAPGHEEQAIKRHRTRPKDFSTLVIQAETKDDLEYLLKQAEYQYRSKYYPIKRKLAEMEGRDEEAGKFLLATIQVKSERDQAKVKYDMLQAKAAKKR